MCTSLLFEISVLFQSFYSLMSFKFYTTVQKLHFSLMKIFISVAAEFFQVQILPTKLCKQKFHNFRNVFCIA